MWKKVTLSFLSLITISSLGFFSFTRTEKIEAQKLDQISKDSKNKNKNKIIIIDLRTDKEVKKTGIIQGSIIKNYYDDDFDDFLKRLDKSKKYVVYCKAGVRSASAYHKMKKINLDVKDYSGGINEWKDLKLDTVFSK